MRKTSAVLATLSLAALALTGCTAAPSFDGASCDRTGTPSLLDSVSVDGDLGEKPDVTVYGPVKSTTSTFADAVVGDGRALTSSVQPVAMEISFYSGDSGEQIFQSAYDSAALQVESISVWAQRSAGLQSVLECATAGTRTVAVLTPEDFGEANVEGFGLSADENVVAVIDVVDVYLAHAEGSLQFNDAQGMPTVVRAPDGTPGVIIPNADAPTESVTQTLIKGDGATVKEGDTLLTNLMAVGWDDKTVVSSTWGAAANNGPAAQELVGATVGSQLLVVSPATDSSAATAIVVDILGIVPAAAE